MLVTLDGRLLQRSFPPGCTLQDVIDQARALLDPQRLVVGVAVDGQDYLEQQLEVQLSQPLLPDVQVDLESADRSTVAVAALRAMAEEMERAADTLAEIARQLNAGQSAEGVRRMGDFLKTWQTCRNVVLQSGALVGRNLLQVSIESGTVADCLADLVERLRDLRDALEARDLVLLADLMQYEIPELCKKWKGLLLSLAESVACGA
ncbi:MAG TPA: hypothetical protein P5223_08255 [Phycisphaerae bacterium]|nr:hypothetical protein [Phycisphaerae bacterium]